MESMGLARFVMFVGVQPHTPPGGLRPRTPPPGRYPSAGPYALAPRTPSRTSPDRPVPTPRPTRPDCQSRMPFGGVG